SIADDSGKDSRSPCRETLMPVLTLTAAEGLVTEALIRARTERGNAESVARALVAAEADGLKGHGLSRTPSDAAQARAGKVDDSARQSLACRRLGVAAIDAGNGFAYPAVHLALDALPQATRQNGIAAAAIHRSHHCGAAGLPVERLAEAGLLALMFA